MALDIRVFGKAAENVLITSRWDLGSLRSWRHCVGARLKFWRRSRVPKKGSRDEAVEILEAPPSNLTRLYYNGSAAKSHSTNTQYRQLRRLRLGQLWFS